MKSVAIIGAGITGLTAAFYLKRQGVPVTVYEAGSRVGGVIQSNPQNGFLVESGPNTLLETSPRIAQLVRDLNLEARRIYTNPNAKNRYVVRDKRPLALPSKVLTTKLLSIRGKFALVREPWISTRSDGKEESVAEFVTRRWNQEVLERLIDPLIAGIYAGDAKKLSIQHAFPKFFELEQKYGSLAWGQFLNAREQKKRGEVSRRDAKMFSFDDGLQVLPDTLAGQLGDAVKLNTPVMKLAQTDAGWRVTTPPSEVEFGAVIYCGTAYKLAELQVELFGKVNEPLTPALSLFGGEREKNSQSGLNIPSPRPNGERVAAGRMTGGLLDLSMFSEIRHPPVASVVLGFRREDVAHPCEGFGMLIPGVEGFNILGTIFSSALFPNRAPAGCVLLTSYLGGERQPELAALPPEKLVELVCEDLRGLLGVRGRPVFKHHCFWPRAIPQYNVGYGKFRDLMTEIELKAPGLFFAGHYRDGISVGDSIVSGGHVAGRVGDFLKI
jgi:protoporphyrinogen/coproporphyrinogen III oxidase